MVRGMKRDLEGRNVLVTGGNTGIGRVTALELARRGARVWVASRSAAKTEPVLAAIRAESGNPDVSFLPLELSELSSVRRCAEQFLALDVPLDTLILNAGLAGARGQTADGFELAFGVNHLGLFLLTERLMAALERAPQARVVSVSSRAHYQAKGLDFEAVRRSTPTRTGLDEYAVSKLCNVLHMAELARRQGPEGRLRTYSLHPGVIASDVWRSVPWPIRPLMTAFMATVEEGAQTTLHCAASADAGAQTGLYYDRSAPREASALARDPALARALWERSEAWTR
jgi:NAD(P)-dependent dehydrogenase (short-subunit alcohol dehydrogenase family)